MSAINKTSDWKMDENASMWEQGCAHYAAGRWTAAARAFNGIDVAAMTACGSSAAPALALEAALEVNGILCARRGAAAGSDVEDLPSRKVRTCVARG